MKKRLLILMSLCCSIQLTAQYINGDLMHDNEDREYQVYLPDAYEAGASLPLVINMHGLGSNIGEQAIYSNFAAVANDNDFIVVFPQGLERSLGGPAVTHWNANFGTDVDDIGFIDALITQLYLDYNIDLSRVYSTGMSNGGYMSYVLACELSDRIAAIASVTGAMTTATVQTCSIDRAMPVMEIHGTADATVSYNGGPGLLSSPDGINFWVENNACDAMDKETINVEDSNTSDNTTVTLEIYPTCDENVEVHFYTIHDGGHSWPGAFPIPSFGNTNQDINASEVIWEFFNRFVHPNPEEVTVSTQELAASNKVRISPNPFKAQLTIENKDGQVLENIQLLNTLGQVVWAQNTAINTPTATLNIPNLEAGIYFLVFEKAGQSFSQKLIKS